MLKPEDSDCEQTTWRQEWSSNPKSGAFHGTKSSAPGHKCLSDKKTTKTRPTLKLLASQHNHSRSLGCGVAGRADEWSPLGGSVPLKYYFQLLSCLLTSLSLRQFPFLLSSEHLHTESQKISPNKSQLSQCFTGVRLKRRDQGELCSWNTRANLQTHTHTVRNGKEQRRR